MAESLQEKYARERKERQQKLQTLRNQRAISRLREPAKERMSRERERRIDDKRVAQGRPSKLQTGDELENAMKNFIARVISKNLVPDAVNEPLQKSQVGLGGEATDNLPGRQKQHQAFSGIPLEFYCWKDGKVAIVSIYATGEPSPL